MAWVVDTSVLLDIHLDIPPLVAAPGNAWCVIF